MIGIMERDERVGLVNPAWEGRPNYMSVEDYGVLLEKKYSGKYIETDWARGFSVVLKRKVLDAIGGIDEIYGLAYFDDVDFSVRAINAGFLVVLALDTYVYHHRNVTFFQVLKGKTWNELHEKNKVIYYSKWGKPLKIVVILDRSNCKDEPAFKKIRDTLYYLARRQHHIDVWSPCDVRAKIPHTNIEVKHYSFFFLTPAVLLDLYLNKWKKEEKKYNAIFGFNKRLADFGVNSVLFKGLLLYGPSGEKDFNDFIKDRADELREKSKEFYSAKV
jgi:GT2 family glycosyltransferase